MRPDVIDLREFYHARLGQVARHLLRYRIRQVWPSVAAMNVLGVGYAVPYLKQFREEADRVLSLMPAAQCVHRWPDDQRNLVALADENELPLPDASMDRVLLMHALENAEQVRRLLREVWRVMASGGRLMVVVPNRRGIWARFERTPFGQGHPYSQGQVSRLLRDNMFQPTARAAALYMPPLRSATLLRAAGPIEKVGQRLGPALAGVLIVEAEKQIYAATAVRTPKRRRPVALPLPAAGRSSVQRRGNLPGSDPN